VLVVSSVDEIEEIGSGTEHSTFTILHHGAQVRAFFYQDQMQRILEGVRTKALKRGIEICWPHASNPDTGRALAQIGDISIYLAGSVPIAQVLNERVRW
jgi:hypothetical protein